MEQNYTLDDLTSPKNIVRIIAPDDRETEPGRFRFSDEKIELFLTLEGGDVRRAAALLLETMATDTVAVDGYIKTYAVELDGSKPASMILKRAALFRSQAAELLPTEDDLIDFYPSWM